MANCRECLKPLPRGAKRCLGCGFDQSRRSRSQSGLSHVAGRFWLPVVQIAIVAVVFYVIWTGRVFPDGFSLENFIEGDTQPQVVAPQIVPAPLNETGLTAEDSSAGLAATPARPTGSRRFWITLADYPPESLMAGEEGTTGYILDIDEKGFVADCHVGSSSGYQRLDDATCEALVARARFEPARDAEGQAVRGSYASEMRWAIGS